MHHISFKGIFRFLFLIQASFLISGCVRFTKVHESSEFADCEAPGFDFTDSTFHVVSDVHSVIDSNLLKKYDLQTLEIANGAGVLYLLIEMEKIKERRRVDTSESAQLKYVAQRQKINSQLHLFTTVLASIAAELDCEGERADQVSEYLKDKENQRVKSLTVFSIVIGSIAGAASAIIQNQDEKASQWIAVTGAVLAAVSGVRSLFIGKKIMFKHERNLLADIWNHPAHSSTYPPGIWYLINEKDLTNRKESMREIICDRWEHYGLLGDKKKNNDQKALFFGKGGKYTQGQLSTRANMLNQMQAVIRLLNQDLQILIFDLSK